MPSTRTLTESMLSDIQIHSMYQDDMYHIAMVREIVCCKGSDIGLSRTVNHTDRWDTLNVSNSRNHGHECGASQMQLGLITPYRQE